MITYKTILKKVQELQEQSDQAVHNKDNQAALICCAKVDVLLELLVDSKQSL